MNRDVRFLQAAIGVDSDGPWWREVLEGAFMAANNLQTALKLVLKLVKGRIVCQYQRARENPSRNRFLQGWLNQNNDLAATIRNL